MFDVDPKWAELVKERGNLPHDLQKRLSGNDRSNMSKGKSPGRPPMMPSPTSQQSASQANLAATSMASGLNFPSLGNLNNSLLSGLSLGNFDPKNNPLLMPFGGLPNLGALSGLGNLGNLSNMSLTNSLFANLAGLGLPSLAGMEAALGATATSTAADTNNPVVSSVSSKNTGSTSISSAGKSRSKMEPPTSKSSVPSTSSASSTIPTTTPFPFFFPNPSLLYTPLGLGGLNPFSMQPGGVSSAYESLAQCGLLNPPTSSASASRKPASSGSSSRQRDTLTDSAPKRKDEKKSRYSVDPGIALQQYTEMTLHNEERRRVEHEKRETLEQNDVADLSDKRTERKNKEQEIKEALEHLSRTSAELLTRNFEDIQRSNEKRGRSIDHSQGPEQQTSSMLEVTLEPVNKKPRIEIEVTTKPVTAAPVATVTPAEVSVVEVEHVARSSSTSSSSSSVTVKQNPVEENNAFSDTSSNANKKESNDAAASVTTTASTTTVTVVATPAATPTRTPTPTPIHTPTPAHTPTPTSTPMSTPMSTPTPTPTPTSTTPVTTVSEDAATSQQSTANAKGGDASKPSSELEEDNKGTKGKKARSGKRLSVEPPPERKNLRSSAGRQARAAAERQARMEGELQSEQQQETHTTSE